MNRKAKFVTGSLYKHLISMSLPSIIVISVNLSVVLADSFFISRLGNAPLAAVGFISPLIETAMGVGLGLGIAVSTGIGQLSGENKQHESNQYLFTSLIITLLVAIVLMLLGFASHQYLFAKLGANATVATQIWDFMRIWYLGLPIFMILFTLNFSMRGHGEIKISSSLYMITAVLNLAFDPILIFGLLGAPKLGIAGAALAGVLARTVTLLTYIVVLRNKHFISMANWQTIKKHSKRIFSVFIPASLTNFIPPISIAITTAMLARISQHAVAAYGITANVQWFAVIPLLVLSGSISPVISQNHGAKLHDRVQQTLKISLYVSVIWGIIIACILHFLRLPILHIYTQSQQVIAVGSAYFEIVPLSYMGWGAIMMFASYFNARSKPIVSTMISALRMIIVFIPLALLLKHYYSYEGIFSALAISNMLIAAVVFIASTYAKPGMFMAAISGTPNSRDHE